MTTKTTPEQAYCFQDDSTATPVEKVRRVLTSLSDAHGHSAHFFDDGFPRGSLHTDAAASLDIFNSMTAQVEALTAERDAALQLAAERLVNADRWRVIATKAMQYGSAQNYGLDSWKEMVNEFEAVRQAAKDSA